MSSPQKIRPANSNKARVKSRLKSRLDMLLVNRGLFPSRERARALILGHDQPFVSRGGFKLAGALDHWQIDVTGRACLDVGASTGGFTDCLLQHGAAYVTAVDTGFGQIAMKLRNDPRVRLMERNNAR